MPQSGPPGYVNVCFSCSQIRREFERECQDLAVVSDRAARRTYLAMSEETLHANHAFWKEVGFLCTTVIFLLSGVLVGE